MKKTSIFCTALIAASALSAHADHNPEGLEISGGAARFDFGNDTPLEDGNGFRLGVGYRFGNPWGVELAYNNAEVDIAGDNGDVTVEHVYLDALYHFNLKGKAQPYLAAGFGYLEAAGSEDTGFDIGVGVKYFVTNNFIIRPDLHVADISELDDVHTILSLSASWLFGGAHTAHTPAPTPTPAAAPLDSDKDGVFDSADNCPTTPEGVSVDAVGCALDSDKDGVFDYQDSCANTPAGTQVNAKGCPALQAPVSIKLNVNFANNSDVVQSQYYPEIQAVADFLKKYPNTKAVIEGHTDTRGSAAYNKSLSQRRADAVAKVLTEQLNADADRVSAIGYGEEQPIADESTREGLLANRRVVAEISTAAE